MYIYIYIAMDRPRINRTEQLEKQQNKSVIKLL